MSTVRQHSLDSLASDLQPLMLPGATTAIRARVLHDDPDSQAVAMLVRFPPGWHRQTGHYTCAEHVVVVTGSLTINDAEWSAGDGLVIPAYRTRDNTHTTPGALAIGWFAERPRWRAGPGSVDAEPIIAWSGVALPANSAAARDYVDLTHQLWWHESAGDPPVVTDTLQDAAVTCYQWAIA